MGVVQVKPVVPLSLECSAATHVRGYGRKLCAGVKVGLTTSASIALTWRLCQQQLAVGMRLCAQQQRMPSTNKAAASLTQYKLGAGGGGFIVES